MASAPEAEDMFLRRDGADAYECIIRTWINVHADVNVQRGAFLMVNGVMYVHPRDLVVITWATAGLHPLTYQRLSTGFGRMRYLERRARVRGVPMVWPKTPAELWS